ncbi:MAG: hypothetical protein WCD18_04095, partial [Thermosynechococcaceae cyanobacterium]
MKASSPNSSKAMLSLCRYRILNLPVKSAIATLWLGIVTACFFAPTAMALQLSSSAFAANAAIPSKYTCDGQDVSPPLQWTGIPAQTRSLVL